MLISTRKLIRAQVEVILLYIFKSIYSSIYSFVITFNQVQNELALSSNELSSTYKHLLSYLERLIILYVDYYIYEQFSANIIIF